MVYISHRLREVLKITDRVVCLRDGERVAELPPGTRPSTSWSSSWPEPTTSSRRWRRPLAQEVVLSVRGRVSFDLHAGEILGLAGLVGAGRSSVLRELFGSRPCGLEVTVGWRAERSPSTPRATPWRAGFAYVPEERASAGLDSRHAGRAQHRVALAQAVPARGRDRDRAALHGALPDPRRHPGPHAVWRKPAEDRPRPSGWRAARRCCCSTSPPGASTLRAKRDVHDVVRELAAAGKGVIVSSSEAEEIAAPVPSSHRPVQGQGSWGAGPKRTHRRQHPEVCNMNDISMPSPSPRPSGS
jgi:ribose transport system ATP-binding protein